MLTFRSSYRAAQKTNQRNARLQLEELEGRCLLSSGFGPLGGMTTGPDGDIWFLEKDRLGRIDPRSGLIQEFAQGINTGNDPSFAGSSIAEAPDGSIWFLSNGQVTRFTPSTNALDTFPLTLGGTPMDSLAIGSNGVVWVLNKQGDTYGIARIDPASGNVQNFAIGEYQLKAIGFGPDGKIWIGYRWQEPGVMDAATGVVQSWTAAYPPVMIEPSPTIVYSIQPGASTNVFAIRVPDLGITWNPPWSDAWAAEWDYMHRFRPYNDVPKIASDGSFWSLVPNPYIAAGQAIGGYDPSTGHQMQFLKLLGEPVQLTPGPDGNIWYEYLSGGADHLLFYIGSLNPATGATETFFLATPSQSPPSSTGNPPSATGATLSSIVGFDIVSAVASFTPQILIGSPGIAYQATVDWGDGTISSVVFTVASHGTYDVVVTRHAYQSAGTYSIIVTIGNFDPANPLGDNPITVFSTATIDPFMM